MASGSGKTYTAVSFVYRLIKFAKANRIRTRIIEKGSKVEAGYHIDKRDRHTRKIRWEQLKDDLKYDEKALDRSVVASDQIRTVIRTFKETKGV